ncbi:lantibiotic dehydratase [Streptomyces sp. NPDC059918]|uniref:lantibiotic dehydratase n=1 Tax=unclassified Streptomyces TaxID=2593676 RepID=UPI003647E9AE
MRGSTGIPTTTHWDLSSWALVKSTGFPYELLERLRAESIADLVAGDDDKAIADAIEGCVHRLVDTCLEGRFLEAVMLSSRGAYEQLHRWLADGPDPGRLRSGDRRKVLLAAMYLQRMCAKNESTSFFGPVYWARVCPGEGLVLETGEPAPARTRTYWTHWAAEAVADVMSADPEVLAQLAPSIPPQLVQREGEYIAVRFVDWPIEVERLQPPDPASLDGRLLARCDGRVDAAGLARAESAEIEVVTAALGELDRRGLVDYRVQVPTGAIDPLSALRDRAAALRGPAGPRWCSVLDTLGERSAALQEAGSLKERRDALSGVFAAFSEVTGAAAERAAGRHYADRSVVIEDGHFPWDRFDIRDPLYGYLRTDMPVLLDLLFELSLARRRRRVEMINEWFVDSFGCGSVPLDRVLTRANADGLGQRLRSADDQVLAGGPSALTDELLRNTDRSRVQLDMDWARRRAGAVDFDTWCVAGADLFVDASSLEAVNAGSFQVVVGEVHGLHDQLLQGLWPALHPQREAFEAEIGTLIDGLTDGRICDPVMGHWRKTLARSEVLPEIEFRGVSARGAGDVARAASLHMSAKSGSLSLESTTLGRVHLTRPPLYSWGDEVESVFTPFTGARLIGADDMFRRLDGADHLPRLTLGRTVVHRETWRIPTHRKKSWTSLSVENQRFVHGLREQYGLPERIYAKFPGEPKPILVDFAVPALVDLFSRHCARTTGPVVVSEMLPDRDGLWLRDQAGRHTSELRFGYYRRSSTAGV